MEHLMTPQETLDALKKALSAPSDDIAKTVSTATGLVAYDLQAPAKNLYPVVTPIRNALPRVGGGTGTATNWRQINSITGSGYDAMGWVKEGQRSARMSYSTSNKSASFVTIGEEDAATMEAINAGRGFEDIQARMTMRLLQKTMLKEEVALLAGNATLSLGTPGTPTLSASGSGATLATATYSVIAVALTLEGYLNSSLSAGVATSQTITGADGNTFVLNGGSSNKSAAATQAVTLGQILFASVTAIQGAVAYAWYVGLAGAEKLEAITTINSASFAAPLAGTHQAATAVTADSSVNADYAFDGLLTAALKSANNAYVKIMATGTAGTGTALTASGRGSIDEIDTMLQTMWDNYELSPTCLYVNAQEIKNITTKVLSNTSGPLLRYEGGGANGYDLTASGWVSFYMNPFALGGGIKIPIRIHPRVPPGTILGWAENLPVQYQSNEVPNVAEVKTRVDYHQIDWPVTTRQREVGVYAEEVLAVYAPFAMGVITNIANG
jgi:hypothetical protein